MRLEAVFQCLGLGLALTVLVPSLAIPQVDRKWWNFKNTLKTANC